MAISLLRGCKVHWIRSCQRVADRVASPRNKELKKNLFLRIASKIQSLELFQVVHHQFQSQNLRMNLVIPEEALESLAIERGRKLKVSV